MSNSIILESGVRPIYMEAPKGTGSTLFTPGVLLHVGYQTDGSTSLNNYDSTVESFNGNAGFLRFISVEDAIEHPDIHEYYKAGSRVFAAAVPRGCLVNLAVAPGTPAIGRGALLYNAVFNFTAGCSTAPKGAPFALSTEAVDNSSGVDVKFIKARMF